MRHFEVREHCPVCQGKEREIIYACPYSASPVKEFLEFFYNSQGMVEPEYLVGAEFLLAECRTCGLVYQVQVPNLDFAGRIYEKWIDPDDAVKRMKEGRKLEYYCRLAQEIPAIIDFLGAQPSKLKILDFGMGCGNWIKLVNAFGCDAYGSDISESKGEYARSFGVKVIKWSEIPGQEFDFINTEQVFEHLANPMETLLHLKKGLKKSGVLKISVPNGSGIRRQLRNPDWKAPRESRRSLNAVSPLEHINCFTVDALSTLGKQGGLEPVQIPILTQYAYSLKWKPFRHFMRNFLNPVLQNMLKQKTRLYFRKTA